MSQKTVCDYCLEDGAERKPYPVLSILLSSGSYDSEGRRVVGSYDFCSESCLRDHLNMVIPPPPKPEEPTA